MADWYCDPTKPQAAYLDYAGTPTAAGTVPTKSEDGNGKGTGTSAMATLVITFTGLPSNNEAITIAGVTFTAKTSGATGNQFNIGADATATATALKNAINASTTSVVSPTMFVACPLQNAVNATSSAGVVTVYTRISGSEWNSVTETENLTNCTITAQWSGGTDGAWGYWTNAEGAIAWPTSVATGQYGAWNGSYLGTIADGDIIHIRSARGGSNVTITPVSNASVQMTSRLTGTRLLPTVYLVDQGTKWSGDSGVFTISLNGSNTVGARNFYCHLDSSIVLEGSYLTETTRSWLFTVTGTVTTTSSLFTTIGQTSTANSTGYIRYKNIAFNNGSNTNATGSYINFNCGISSAYPGDQPNMVFEKIYYRTQSGASPYSSPSSASLTWLEVRDCLHDHNGFSGTSTNAMIRNAGSIGLGQVNYIGSEWRNFPANNNLSGLQLYSGAKTIFNIINCKYPNIKVYGHLVGSAGANTSNQLLRSISVSSIYGTRQFVYETFRQLFAWVDSAAPRTSNSFLPDGTTNFSIRTAVTSEASQVSESRPIRFPRMAKLNTLANGARTATLRLLVDSNYVTQLGRAPNNKELWVEIYYVDSSGNYATATSYAGYRAAGSALTAGSNGDWTDVSYDVNGNTHNYTPYTISVSLPSVGTLTELNMEFIQGIQTNSTDNLIFLDPEWSLA